MTTSPQGDSYIPIPFNPFAGFWPTTDEIPCGPARFPLRPWWWQQGHAFRRVRFDGGPVVSVKFGSAGWLMRVGRDPSQHWLKGEELAAVAADALARGVPVEDGVLAWTDVKLGLAAPQGAPGQVWLFRSGSLWLQAVTRDAVVVGGTVAATAGLAFCEFPVALLYGPGAPWLDPRYRVVLPQSAAEVKSDTRTDPDPEEVPPQP
jgi:hypothetical protein